MVSFAAVVPLVADDAAEFKKARAKIQQKLRSKQIPDRVDAVREAGQYPVVDSAKLIVQLGLADKVDEVRKAAYEELLKQREQPEVEALILQKFKESRRNAFTKESMTLLALAASTRDDTSRADVIKTLDEVLGTNKADALLMAAFIDGLADEGSLNSLAVVTTLIKSKHFGKHFGFHRTVVQALTQIRHKESVDVLLELLPSLRGETLKDALAHLTAISGKKLGHKPAEWRAWWLTHREAFEFPIGNAVVAADEKGIGALRYYDLPINAQKMVFIIDISASMRGAKMAAAQRELANVIANLSEDAYFNVVAFHTNVFVWHDKLVKATPENKRQAASYVANLQPDMFTGTFDALQAATVFEPEAIYMVTDGEPTTGKVVAQGEIVAIVSQANRATRISIYTIGIAAQAAHEFLQALSGNNWGDFREVRN